MQTFWRHLTFLNLGQPLLARLGPRTLLPHPVDQLDEAQALPALYFGLKGRILFFNCFFGEFLRVFKDILRFLSTHPDELEQPHEPGGDQVEGRRSGGRPVHVSDQLGQAELPLDVGLCLCGIYSIINIL